MWIPRPADAQLDALLAANDRLITVHGLGGSGGSTLVARALGRAGQPGHVRVDLAECREPHEASRRIEAARQSHRGARLFLLDDVHSPSAARAGVQALLAASAANRVVISARGPLGLDGEVRVPLGGLDALGAQALFAEELRRLGVVASAETIPLASVADGWPIAVAAAARAVRVLGPAVVAQQGLFAGGPDPRCAAAIEGAWRALSSGERMVLGVLSLARCSLDATDAAALAGGAADRLCLLLDAGLLVGEAGRVRVPSPVAALVRREAGSAGIESARRRLVALVLREGERARARWRRDPVRAHDVLTLLRDELMTLGQQGAPRTAVRAVLALEPLLTGEIERRTALALWSRATEAAATLDEPARVAVALGHARTLITRGQHEDAERLLHAELPWSHSPLGAAYRSIFRGHIEAWRGALDAAGALLDEAAALLAGPHPALDHEALADAREDALLQRLFVAFQRRDLDEAERLGRQCAAEASIRPSPRLGAMVRRFMAEILLLRGAPAKAVPLLAQSRDELIVFGDRVGALFVRSRLIEALRAAGEVERARVEAEGASQLAARADEGAMELAVLGASDGDGASTARVAELAWQAQIPALRQHAEDWLAARGSPGPPVVLELDGGSRSAAVGTHKVSLAHRATLWRILEVLAQAHQRGAVTAGEALFVAGWPGERAELLSRRKRVQTAVWTLRRLLLGDLLRTLPEGYALAPELRVDRR